MSIKEDVNTARHDIQEMSGLLGDALSQFAKLFQNEIDLAKAELTEKIRTVSIAAGLLIGGAILFVLALTMALLAPSAVLMVAGWSPAMSYLTAAIAAAVVAGSLVAIGIIGFRCASSCRRKQFGNPNPLFEGFATPKRPAMRRGDRLRRRP